MKKTLAALIVSAFAATAANAAVVYDNDGTKFEVNGSLRIMLEKSNKGGEYNTAGTQKSHSHSGLKNADSRIEFKVRHDLGEGYFAFARTEIRFDGSSDGGDEDGFGSLRTHRAYVGLGKKELGELTFGRQVTLADDVGIADDMFYGILPKDTYSPTSGKSVVRYDYKGIDGLQIGASYQFAENRNSTTGQNPNDVVNGKLENGVQFGFLYNGMEAATKNGFLAEGVYGRTNYKTADDSSSHKNGYRLSLGYDFDGFIVSVDGGYFKAKNITSASDAKLHFAGDSKGYFLSPGFQAQITKDSRIYGNYLYEQQKTDNQTVEQKRKTHGFLLGTDYRLHQQVVTYVEGKYVQHKDYVNGDYNDRKVKDKAIGVGMRVYF